MLRFLLLLLGLTIAAPLHAEVLVRFWSHEQDQNYPHAFLTMQGRIDATGRQINDSIGFSARRISPRIFFGSVDGELERLSRGYLARPTNHLHFALRLNDAQYARLEAFIAGWRRAGQPSYNLSTRNCVHFVMEAAAVLGLNVNRDSRYLRQPDAFLDEVVALNPILRPSAVAAGR